MATSRESAEESFSFLDLTDCPVEERERILTILHGMRTPTQQQVPPPQQQPPPGPDKAFPEKEKPVQLQYNTGQQQHQQQQQQQPYVYINNVTANVNVHHPLPKQAAQPAGGVGGSGGNGGGGGGGSHQEPPPQLTGPPPSGQPPPSATHHHTPAPPQTVPSQPPPPPMGGPPPPMGGPPPAAAAAPVMLPPPPLGNVPASLSYGGNSSGQPHPFLPPGAPAGAQPFMPMVSQAGLVSKNNSGVPFYPNAFGVPAGYTQGMGSAHPHPTHPPPQQLHVQAAAAAQQQQHRLRGQLPQTSTAAGSPTQPPSHSAAFSMGSMQATPQQQLQLSLYQQQLFYQQLLQTAAVTSHGHPVQHATAAQMHALTQNAALASAAVSSQTAALSQQQQQLSMHHAQLQHAVPIPTSSQGGVNLSQQQQQVMQQQQQHLGNAPTSQAAALQAPPPQLSQPPPNPLPHQMQMLPPIPPPQHTQQQQQASHQAAQQQVQAQQQSQQVVVPTTVTGAVQPAAHPHPPACIAPAPQSSVPPPPPPQPQQQTQAVSSLSPIQMKCADTVSVVEEKHHVVLEMEEEESGSVEDQVTAVESEDFVRESSEEPPVLPAPAQSVLEPQLGVEKLSIGEEVEPQEAEQSPESVPPPVRNSPEPAGAAGAASAPLAAVPAAVAPAKSWASLFKRETGGHEGGDGMGDRGNGHQVIHAMGMTGNEKKPMAMIQPYNPKLAACTAAGKNAGAGMAGCGNAAGVLGNADNGTGHTLTSKDMELADMLRTYQLNHRASVIKPRGLSNRSNWCFVNAILQALLACPPFYNLMKAVPKDLLARGKILQAVHTFFAEFSPLEHFPKLNNRRRKNEDLPQGKILEPASIYNYLLNSLSPTDTFKVVEGRQEDAEEFLTFLLNGLNDEMLALFKSVDESQGQETVGSANMDAAAVPEEDEEEEDEWQEVGPKNKSVVTRRGAQGNCKIRPPLAEIFQGQMRSCLQPVNGDPTATLQPFFSLQLDIQSSDVTSVNEALVNNFATEMIDGYVCPKTKQAVEASKSTTLEELPPILVLHLKRFVYDGSLSGKGSQKLLKNVDFPVDLEIPSKILSPATKPRWMALKQRSYKLFAVVYHNGTEATKGHYVTDIYHTGLATWIRADDSILKVMPESLVLAHSANSVPYILFYRRADTISAAAAAAANHATSSSQAHHHAPHQAGQATSSGLNAK